MIRILYFASLRDRLNTDQETLEIGAIGTIGELKQHLKQRGDDWKTAFAPDQQVLSAVNHEMAQDDTPVSDGDEVGFFPPVTGG